MRQILLVTCCMALASIGCPVNKSQIETKPTSLSNSGPEATGSVFDINTICSVTAKAASGTPFAALSGGSWKKDGLMDEEWDYSCSEDKDRYLKEDEAGIVVVNYGTIGGKQDVKYVSIEYTASYHGGLDGNERRFRTDYINFIENLTKELYGQPLPPNVRNDLMGRKEFNKADTGTPIGTGYINYLLSSPLPKAVDIDVKLFGSKAVYDKFKDR